MSDDLYTSTDTWSVVDELTATRDPRETDRERDIRKRRRAEQHFVAWLRTVGDAKGCREYEAAGGCVSHFGGAREQRIVRALLAHHAYSDAPPCDADLTVRGALRSDLDTTDWQQDVAMWVAHHVTVADMAATIRRHWLRDQEHVARERAADAIVGGFDEAADAYLDRARELHAQIDGPRIGETPRPGIALLGTAEIFAELPPMEWVCRGLMIGAGRPTLLCGYGAAAKTLACQSLLLSVASGRRIWGHFDVDQPRPVIHLDLEQGERDTRCRYQRLALGHGIDSADLGDRLRMASMPGLYLTSEGAEAKLTDLARTAALILIDSFRAAVLGVDENDSTVRQYLDMLTRISNATGCAFVVIHHAGKPDKNGEFTPRGSSGIEDASAVNMLVAGKSHSDPRRLRMKKPPTSVAGAPVEACDLLVEDVEFGGDPTAGVRVMWRAITTADPQADRDELLERDTRHVLESIRKHPDETQGEIRERLKIQNQRVGAILDRLVSNELIVALPRRGKGGGQVYRCH